MALCGSASLRSSIARRETRRGRWGVVVRRLRAKINKGLATRYLAAGEPQPRLGHDVAVGHISYGGVVVDGQYLTFHELAAILSAHEGWQFKLEIVDPYDAIP